MIRLVLDTNTLISAVGWRHSKQRRILGACLFKKYLLIESADLLNEFVKVISRPKFSFVSGEERNDLVTRLMSHCEIVESKKELNIIKQDPADNRVLECSLEGKADYIITGDRHLLNLRQFGKTEILTASEFLQKV
jgi:putative PIN family toxin of toxin-antitoxin system